MGNFLAQAGDREGGRKFRDVKETDKSGDNDKHQEEQDSSGVILE